MKVINLSRMITALIPPKCGAVIKTPKLTAFRGACGPSGRKSGAEVQSGCGSVILCAARRAMCIKGTSRTSIEGASESCSLQYAVLSRPGGMCAVLLPVRGLKGEKQEAVLDFAICRPWHWSSGVFCKFRDVPALMLFLFHTHVASNVLNSRVKLRRRRGIFRGTDGVLRWIEISFVGL